MFRLLMICLIALAILSCSTGTISESAQGTLGGDIVIGIVDNEITPFKQSVVDSLKAHYGAAHSVSVLPLISAGNVEVKPYKVFVLVDQLKIGGMMNGSMRGWKQSLDPKRTVLFMTAGDSEWKYEKNDVVAVTSASKNVNFPALIGELTAKIDAILSSQSTPATSDSTATGTDSISVVPTP